MIYVYMKLKAMYRANVSFCLVVLISIWVYYINLLSGEPDYFGRNEISSGGDLSHYSSASLY